MLKHEGKTTRHRLIFTDDCRLLIGNAGGDGAAAIETTTCRHARLLASGKCAISANDAAVGCGNHAAMQLAGQAALVADQEKDERSVLPVTQNPASQHFAGEVACATSAGNVSGGVFRPRGLCQR